MKECYLMQMEKKREIWKFKVLSKRYEESELHKTIYSQTILLTSEHYEMGSRLMSYKN